MSDVAVRVEKLGKQYRIGAQQEQYPTLRSTLVSGFKRLLAGYFTHETRENTIWALQDISFEIEQGEVVGIIGRNGAGKSTLLKLLAHITEPTQGRISLHGRVGSLLEVGTGFHPELTGRDNIFLNGAILGMKKIEIERKFDEIVAFSEIEKFLDTPVKRYSSGMYVRLAFAVAAHLETEILLIDEVLAVGDSEFQKKCIGKMNNIAKAGRTVLFISHNLQMIESFCDRGLYIQKGCLQFDGKSREAVMHYLKNQNQEQILEQDINEFPRRPGEGGSFRLTRIELRFPTADSSVWQPLQFYLDYECLAQACEVSPSIEVWRFDNTCAFTCDGEDNDLILMLRKGMQGRVRVDIPAPNLPPGQYFVRAVARSGGKNVLDWVDGALVFDIKSAQSGSTRMSERHLGLRPRSIWQSV
jgi:lipopolysaccharide transport system ATP-binding protein